MMKSKCPMSRGIIDVTVYDNYMRGARAIPMQRRLHEVVAQESATARDEQTTPGDAAELLVKVEAQGLEVGI
jgi:hypothetical protein